MEGETNKPNLGIPAKRRTWHQKAHMEEISSMLESVHDMTKRQVEYLAKRGLPIMKPPIGRGCMTYSHHPVCGEHSRHTERSGATCFESYEEICSQAVWKRFARRWWGVMCTYVKGISNNAMERLLKHHCYA